MRNTVLIILVIISFACCRSVDCSMYSDILVVTDVRPSETQKGCFVYTLKNTGKTKYLNEKSEFTYLSCRKYQIEQIFKIEAQ